MLNLSLPPDRPASSASDGEAGDENGGAARVGRTLKGKWRLDAILGSGGTATVYAATHRNGNRVAVKVLHPQFSAMPAERERFTREGFFANKVDHPDVVRVLDEDVDEEGSPFLVMELLDGEPLVARWKAMDYRLPVPEALWIADRLLGVLEAAHGRGIVHRDIKPENLFLTAVGGLKVLDFGIARLGGVGSGTIRGIVLGTPGFTAPEQARGEWDIVGPRTDIWAVGATLFALLTGQLVHEEQQTAAHLLRVSMEPVPPVRQIEPSVPDAVARLIDRALAFSPEQRFASAVEMRQAIAAAFRLTFGCNLGPKRPSGETTGTGYAPTLRVTTGTTAATVLAPRVKVRPRFQWADRWDAAAMATAFFALGGIVVGYFASAREPSAPGAIQEAALVAPPAALVPPPPPSASTPEPSWGAPVENEIAPIDNAAALLPGAPEPPPPPLFAPPSAAVASPSKNAGANAAAAVRAPTRAQGERPPPAEGTASQAAPLPVTALPPAALPGSASKRPPRPPTADRFDFVDTRR